MARVVATGCAGFIGSHLVDALLDTGETVVGIDSLTEFYDLEQKQSNVASARAHSSFEFVEADQAQCSLDVIEGAEVVFHLAGQPGVRSLRVHFATCLDRTVLAAQRLLEAATRSLLPRLVYASSSSVHGNADRYPVDESMRPAPFSPYGLTKLAEEHTCGLYAAHFGLSTVALTYFTVYGPRQRPDMAFHWLFEAALDGTAFPLSGSGEQVRDFTFVGDVVRATLLAGAADMAPGLMARIAGGAECSMNEVFVDRPVEIERRQAQHGDVHRTRSHTDRAEEQLGWIPGTGLRKGLAQPLDWHRLCR